MNVDSLFITKRERFNGKWALVSVPKKLSPRKKESVKRELEGLTRKIVLRKLRSESRI